MTAANGIRGFVHSSRVERQAAVPSCGSHRGVSAGRWAAMQIGETVPNPGEQANNPTMNRWSGWCYVLAWDSHALSHGVQPVTGKGNATNTSFEYQRRGATSTDFRDAAMNIGSIVFWTTGKAGHAAIYVGNGYVVSTQGFETDLLPVARRSMASLGTPAGWVAPANI